MRERGSCIDSFQMAALEDHRLLRVLMGGRWDLEGKGKGLMDWGIMKDWGNEGS